MDLEHKAGIIAGVSAFSGLDDEQVNLLASLFAARQVGVGEILVNEAERVEKLGIIVEGEVRVFLPSGGAQARPEEIDLAVFTVGDLYGEYSFVDLRPASASVMVSKPALLMEVDQRRLHLMLDDHCQIARQVYYNLLLLLIDRLRSDDKELDVLTSSWT